MLSVSFNVPNISEKYHSMFGLSRICDNLLPYASRKSSFRLHECEIHVLINSCDVARKWIVG